MNTLDNFKSFVRENPNLINYVNNGTMSWQKFYEIYDLYGDKKEVWNKYLTVQEKKEDRTLTPRTGTFKNIIDMTKNIDANKLQEGISSVEKAIALFSDMVAKDKNEKSSYIPRPIYRKFDD